MDTRALTDSRHDTIHFREADPDADMIRDVSRVTWVGVFINVALAVLKTAAGLMADSKALLADAVHTISDLATDAAVLIGVRYWSAPADSEHPHGHRKIETLITLAIGVALASVGLSMGYDSLATLIAPGDRHEVSRALDFATWLAFGAAVASIVSKELLYRWTAARGVQLESSALVANAWHHRSDALSSIPPVLSLGGEVIASRLGYNLWYLDAIGTLAVCFMLLQAAWEVMRPTLGTLLDESADRRLCSAIRKTVLDTPGVIGTHRIRTRVIGSNAVAVDLHVTVDKNLRVWEGHSIAAKVKYQLIKLNVETASRVVDVLVHIEPSEAGAEESMIPSGSDTMVDWQRHPGIAPDTQVAAQRLDDSK